MLVGAQAAVAAPANVSVRVEGGAATLVPATTVLTKAAAFSKTGKAGEECSGTSAGGALEVATGGDWGGRWDSAFGQQVERIRTVTHPIGQDYSGRYWAFYVNDEPASVGACAFELQEGDEVLLYSACGGATTECFSEPLDFSAPATVRPGAAFLVTVKEITTTYGGPPDYAATTSETPSEGALVSGADSEAVTRSNGTATLRISQRGPATLVATKGDKVREAAAVCVTDGADGFCGTTKPGEAAPPSTTTAAAGCVTAGDDGRCGTRDQRAPEGSITSISDGQRFRRAEAPRELTGAVTADPSGLSTIKLRLTRRYKGRCEYLSGRQEVFRRTRCGRGLAFSIGARAPWSYLLPSALKPGRYVLDVIAIDKALNRDVLARGRNRIVFTVG